MAAEVARPPARFGALSPSDGEAGATEGPRCDVVGGRGNGNGNGNGNGKR